LVVLLLVVGAWSLGAADSWADSVCDTGRNCSWLTDAEKDIIREHNRLRVDPARYAEEVIKPIIGFYEGILLKRPGEIAIRTHEGVGAAQECYQALKAARPAPALVPSKGITLAARDHAADQSRTGRTGHDGSDGSQMHTRIQRYGSGNTYGENISYGRYQKEIGKRIISQLLIDDGVPSRGHRVNILRESFFSVGVAINTHPNYGMICVLDYAGQFTDKPEVARADPRIPAGFAVTPVSSAASVTSSSSAPSIGPDADREDDDEGTSVRQGRRWRFDDPRGDVTPGYLDIVKTTAQITSEHLIVQIRLASPIREMDVNAQALAKGALEWAWYTVIDVNGDGKDDFGMGIYRNKPNNASPARMSSAGLPKPVAWKIQNGKSIMIRTAVDGSVRGRMITLRIPLGNLSGWSGNAERVVVRSRTLWNNGSQVRKDVSEPAR